MSPPTFAAGDDELTLLRDGAEAFPSMLAAIAAAKYEVLLEMYWIGDDACGRRFRDALALRAQSGVRVRVIHDAVGCRGLPSDFFSPLRAHGGEVLEFHPLSPLRSAITLDAFDRRDHRKMLIVDRVLAYAGGINLAREWLPLDEGGDGWRDDMVRVRGPAAQELRWLFYDTWSRRPFAVVPDDVIRLPRRRTRPVYVLANRWRRRRSIRREYLVRIANARRSVDIANSYFIPNRSVRGALFRAQKRGARVRVLVPWRGDIPIVQQAVEAMFETLLEHGVEVYTMRDPVLHEKTAIIDGSFAMIGSYNLDARSWSKNLEANLAIEDVAFARHVRAWFDRDCQAASRVDLTAWRGRPLRKRVLEWSSFALRRLW